MIRVLRRHKKYVFWGLVILVVPTFIMWGGYRKSARQGSNGAPAVAPGTTVVRVGFGVVTVEQFRQALNAEIERRAKYAPERPTYDALVKDGTANRLMDRLIDGAILEDLEIKRPFNCQRDFLVEQLKKDPAFQDQNGQFSTETWNAFVDAPEPRNWNAIYAQISMQMNRQTLVQSLQASARVLDSDIRDQFDAAYSKMKVKYATVEPPIVPSEQEIQAQYDADPKVYQIPERRVAQYVAVSMKPPRPALVDEIVQRARAGEDFAELAKQHSGWFDKDNGGDMNWVSEKPNMPDYVRSLLALPAGTVSDPIEGVGGYFIYKAEEERTDPATNLREVKARQIHIRPELSEADRADRETKANDLLTKAKESGDLAAAAAAAGLEMKTTDPFSLDAAELKDISRVDVRPFTAGFANIGADQFAGLITARENLYVAKVIQVEPAVLQPLEAVRERVAKDAADKIRSSPEYAKKIDDICKDIAVKTKSLAEVPALQSELGITIQETKEFTPKESAMVQGPMLRASEVYDQFKGKEPGAFAGPLKGMGPGQSFLELTSLSPPDEAVWTPEKRAEEEKKLRATALQMAQFGRVMDYLKYLKDRTPADYNNEAYASVLGENTDSPEPKGLPKGEPVAPRPVDDEGPLE